MENRQAGRLQNLQGQAGYSFIAYPDLREFALAREELQEKDRRRVVCAKNERFTFDEVFA